MTLALDQESPAPDGIAVVAAARVVLTPRVRSISVQLLLASSVIIELELRAAIVAMSDVRIVLD
jgi:hypothetical protein